MIIGCDYMRVIISAGGTGGHIYPALAIINKIKEMELHLLSRFVKPYPLNRTERSYIEM